VVFGFVIPAIALVAMATHSSEPIALSRWRS
jgi:hypothetical protein